MSKPEKKLLSTRPLPTAVIEEGAAKGVVIETLSFITTKAIEDAGLFQKIKTLAAEKRTVVFTSMNAVEAVAAQVSVVPRWTVYALGNATQKLIAEKWGEDRLAATAENAERLGERLIDDGELDVLFFCGNIRRDELPNKLRSEGGRVEEVIVYETIETPVKLPQHYDGILFFSPSAVQAFFQQNKPGENTSFFAIGKTTAEALHQRGVKQVVVGNKTDKAELARLAIHVLTGNEQKTFVG